MDEESRRKSWLALARVPGAVAAGIAHRFSFAGAKGDALAEAFAGAGGEWSDVVEEAKLRLPSVEAEIAAAAKVGARLVDVEDDEYPVQLRGISDPPPALFVRGELTAADARAAAVIGSREATRYGIDVTKMLVPPLAGKGVTIVSGMARGIDSTAHRAALRAGGRTIAVLGTGIDVSYPDSSRDLYQEIPKRGAVLSEVAPGTPPLPWVFPPRNRIISGLSKVVVIVEARLRSGTAVTARHALDQGREVGVVPGDIDLARSAGTNSLLVDGAFAVRSADDVLVYGFGDARNGETVAPRPVPPGLDKEAARLWLELAASGGATLESLVHATGLGAAMVMAGVGRLERAGLVRGDGWGRYATTGGAEAR